MDRTRLKAEHERALADQRSLCSQFPELPFMIARMRQTWAPEVFELINAYIAVERRVERLRDEILKGELDLFGEVPIWVEDGA